jgi:hypothetical protein
VPANEETTNMSMSAEIAVLYAGPCSEQIVPPVMGFPIMNFSAVEDADLHCWISQTGQLEYRTDPRNNPLMGEPSLEGRLWIGTLGRHWTPKLSEYGGHPGLYAATLRAVANMPGVVHVWYGVLTGDSGCSDVLPVSEEWITSFFSATQSA